MNINMSMTMNMSAPSNLHSHSNALPTCNYNNNDNSKPNSIDWSSLDGLYEYIYYPSLPYSQYMSNGNHITGKSSDFSLHNGGNDHYYRQAKTHGYRARSAYKLLHIDLKYNIFNDTVYRAVDLCAAPGSWSQVLVEKLYVERHIKPPSATMDTDSQLYTYTYDSSMKSDNNADNDIQRRTQIVSIDIQEMAPLDGVHVIQGDITEHTVAEKVIKCFTHRTHNDSDSDNHTENSRSNDNESNLADLVICDAAPDVSGIHMIDEYMHHTQLLLSAFNITTYILRKGGTFICKIFKSHDLYSNNYSLLSSQYKEFFDHVDIYKPPSSRERSAEHFMICRGYKGIPINPYKNIQNNNEHDGNGMNVKLNNIVRYMSNGDLNWDMPKNSHSDISSNAQCSDGNVSASATTGDNENRVRLSSFIKNLDIK